ncbi:sugar 3,4-ketoisomerase [Mesonia maritima]|uniref:dTDP-4-dehydrorhamnose 3,5-epimerase-like enzyme n=1 Tax=Mesonia maritima TaxID=1793873 RepID=A0ABU1K6H5_9FLAO|nr:FdtA/QdtA family cupin domain-containing protein [Mesonia maritima]MDR6301204.1 dTDP-4-dehydrorhamnose 3,5-epimerase-like enzyme [Mesonia maritima]
MKKTLNDIQEIKIPKISDPDGRGNLSVIEKEVLPYKIERVYYLYDVPSDATRGGHAHINLQQSLIALSGSFDVVLDDGNERKIISLNKPDKALFIPQGIWRELENFSSGAVCLALVSEIYKEEDYIRDYKDFLTFKSR